jgi:hypothetical protein
VYSVVGSRTGRRNQPCCIKIVKWYFSSFCRFFPGHGKDMLASDPVKLNRLVEHPEFR